MNGVGYVEKKFNHLQMNDVFQEYIQHKDSMSVEELSRKVSSVYDVLERAKACERADEERYANADPAVAIREIIIENVEKRTNIPLKEFTIPKVLRVENWDALVRDTVCELYPEDNGAKFNVYVFKDSGSVALQGQRKMNTVCVKTNMTLPDYKAFWAAYTTTGDCIIEDGSHYTTTCSFVHEVDALACVEKLQKANEVEIFPHVKPFSEIRMEVQWKYM